MSYTYTLARLFVLLAKPLSIVVLLKLDSSDTANQLAMFYLIGAVSTVLFSFSTYRVLVPKIGLLTRPKTTFFLHLQNIQILFFLLILFAVSCVGHHFYPAISAFCFISGIEFAFHEKQRNLLYQGNFNAYARLLILSYLCSFSFCLFFIFFDPLPSVASILILAAIPIMLCQIGPLSIVSFRRRTRALFGIIFAEKANWLITGSSRIYMVLDRIVFSIIGPESLWLVTLLSQYFLLPVLAYDLFHLGPNKHKILKHKDELLREPLMTSLFGGIEFRPLILIVTGAICLSGCLVLFGPLLDVYVTFYMAVGITFLGFLYGVSEKLHEIVVWSKGSSWIAILYISNIVLLSLVAFSFDVKDPTQFWFVFMCALAVLKLVGLAIVKKRTTQLNLDGRS